MLFLLNVPDLVLSSSKGLFLFKTSLLLPNGPKSANSPLTSNYNCFFHLVLQVTWFSNEDTQCPKLSGSKHLPRGPRWWLGLGCGSGFFPSGGLHLWGHQEPGCLPPGSDGRVWGEQQPCVVGHFHLCLRFRLLWSVSSPALFKFLRDFVYADKLNVRQSQEVMSGPIS